MTRFAKVARNPLLPLPSGGYVWFTVRLPGTFRKLWKGYRRSKRLLLSVPVLVYGRTKDNNPFSDITQTLSVNAHGGLVALTVPVHEGQRMILVNNKTQEERECRAVYIGAATPGTWRVGVEFLRPAPNFWRIHFPADDHDLARLRGTLPTQQPTSA